MRSEGLTSLRDVSFSLSVFILFGKYIASVAFSVYCPPIRALQLPVYGALWLTLSLSLFFFFFLFGLMRIVLSVDSININSATSSNQSCYSLSLPLSSDSYYEILFKEPFLWFILTCVHFAESLKNESREKVKGTDEMRVRRDILNDSENVLRFSSLEHVRSKVMHF